MPSPTQWHKRYHPLRRQWVVYAAHRNARPWSFPEEELAAAPKPTYDPACYLCPGNARVGGARNPDYADLYLFPNDHPVVGPEAPVIDGADPAALYRTSPARGYAKVLCYHPRHDLTMSTIPPANVARVFEVLRDETRAALADPTVHSLLVFENKGELVGVSNPHPHCQLYALDFPVGLVTTELAAARAHRERTERNLFADILDAELRDRVRIVAEREYAVAFVPFFARFAYEVMIFPKRRHATLTSMTDAEFADLASVFQEVNRRYDALFRISMPYVMSLLQAPLDGSDDPDYHLHFLIQPPLRQPGLQKFLAGPETGGDTFMADTIPEEKAAELAGVTLDPTPEDSAR